VSAAAVFVFAAVLTGGMESDQGWSEALVPLATPVPAPAPTESPAPAVAVDPPTRVRIPAIRVDSTLETLGLDASGALEAPKDFARAGWYAGGTVPGDIGPAVIAGHVDSHTGPAVFFRLYQLRRGDAVQVARGDRWVSFRVVGIDRYPKNQFPTVEVYGPTPDAQLRLITCGGSFDTGRRSYVDNVVVYAVADQP
jgi:LPXTG-site transpeptidase (sortase) family protein